MISRLAHMIRIWRTGALLDVRSPAAATVAARTPESQWFWEHYDEAARQVLEAFQSEGLSVSGKMVADIGCGDGFTDLGILHKARPHRLVGFDVNLTNREYLQRRAHEEGVDVVDLGGLDFERSTTTSIPAEDGTFDFAFSWSAFEHISRPIEVLTEIRRILSPAGAFSSSYGHSTIRLRARISGSGFRRTTIIYSGRSATSWRNSPGAT
jgi:ubiquinone/menaquinone biosynthesis C-methylase UbiE